MKYLIFAEGPTDEKIRELKDRLLELNERAQVVQATADGENRQLTEDETKELDAIFAEFKAVEDDIRRREIIAEQRARLADPQGRQTEPQMPEPQAPQQHSQGPADPQQQQRRQSTRRPSILSFPEDRGKWGWRHFGEYAMAVRSAADRSGAVIDPRLVANAPTTYSSEGVGADGGFLVPPEWRQEIWKKVSGESTLFSRTNQTRTSRNITVFPTDENAPWDSNNGVQAYWEKEGGQIKQSKLALGQATIRLNKLTALVPVSEELLEDAVGLESFLLNHVNERFDWALNFAIVQGTGAGEPLGILNSPSLVSVQKETSQAADTIVVENLDKMWNALYAPLRADAVWLINQDVEPQLLGLMRYVKNASGEIVNGIPAYMPPGGVSGSPYATLYNRPIIATQACETLGDKGDIILTNLRAYNTAYRTTGIKTDVSMHLWFDYDTAAFRFILRIAGRPRWAKALTARDGSTQYSWAVTLDERAE